MEPLERLAARMVCVGFDGRSITPDLRRLMGRGVTGAILFKRNVGAAAEFAELTRELKAAAGRPFLITVDQEGGRVMRLRDGFTPIPSMRLVGQAKDGRLAFELGRILARELRAVNVDLDLAPVMDVDTNPANPVIGDRSFGPTAELVSWLGCALLTGIQAEGVGACAKHFPGHGDTAHDSHFDLPRLAHPLERLMHTEVPPFEAAVRAGVASIMTAHVIFDPIDPNYPATLSPPVMGILRKRLRFDGLVLSDDMEMKAIAEHFGFDDAVRRAVAAGVDLFLISHTPELQERAIEVIVRGVESGEIPRTRLEETARRLDRFTGRFVREAAATPDLSVLNCDAHRKVVDEILAAAGANDARGDDPTERLRH